MKINSPMLFPILPLYLCFAVSLQQSLTTTFTILLPFVVLFFKCIDIHLCSGTHCSLHLSDRDTFS